MSKQQVKPEQETEAQPQDLRIDPETGFVEEILENMSEPGHAQAAPSGPEGGASLEQVREILFGAHSRGLEQRLVRVEQRLDQSIATLTDQTTERVENLERYIKTELSMLLEKLGAQREERTALFQQIKGDVDSNGKKLDKRINELSDRSAKAQSDIRAELLRQVNIIMDEMEQKCGSLGQELARETARMRSDLVDRVSLSEALTRVALGLNNQEDHPGVNEPPAEFEAAP